MLILPLRQSLCETAACPQSYKTQVIDGKKMPGGLQSARGTEVHAVMSRYINHCAVRKVGSDWAKFDEIAYGAGSEAAQILNGMRDNYVVDFNNVYDSELTLSVFEPIPHHEFSLEAEGTLDVLLFPTPSRAKIEDFKSHPRPFDPDTFQSKLYPYMVFVNFPAVEEVIFELIFVRYANARRSVVYTREDIPMLRQEVMNARIRQIRMHKDHEAGVELQALPGSHCAYCPLLQSLGCPIAEYNPHTTMSLEERLRFAVWSEQVNGVNREVLKNAVDASGRPVEYRDGNGRLISFGATTRESVQFPLLKVLPYLMEHKAQEPADIAWMDSLLISSTKLKSYLKAKKRIYTHQQIMDNAAEPISKTTFEVTYPAETEETPRVAAWQED